MSLADTLGEQISSKDIASLKKLANDKSNNEVTFADSYHGKDYHRFIDIQIKTSDSNNDFYLCQVDTEKRSIEYVADIKSILDYIDEKHNLLRG